MVLTKWNLEYCLLLEALIQLHGNNRVCTHCGDGLEVIEIKKWGPNGIKITEFINTVLMLLKYLNLRSTVQMVLE